MKLVLRHISYLLLTCHEVNVPGLGVFSSLCERASFDIDNGIFYPAKTRIIFSENVKLGNNTLLNSLVRELNVDKKKALNIIMEFVSQVKSKLNKNKYCKLEGLGYLIIKEDLIKFHDTFWKHTPDEALFTR